MEKENKKKATNQNGKKPETKKVENKNKENKEQAKKTENKTKQEQAKKVETKSKANKEQTKKPETKSKAKQEQTKKPETKSKAKQEQTKKSGTKNKTKQEQAKKPEIKNKNKTKNVKKVESKVEKANKNEKHLVKKKGKKANKFIEIIKKKWLIDGTRTLILVAAIVLVFVAVNVVLNNLELTPIDLSQEKLYTLSEGTKEKVRNQNIEQDVNIYFIGSVVDSSTIDLVKQFSKINEHIKVEEVDKNKRPDLIEKYQIDSSSQGIIIESGEKSKVLTPQDLVTYDNSTGETISIADDKFANAIIAVTSPKIPKIYFLNGYSEFSLENGMSSLSMYLQNEIMEVYPVNITIRKEVPEDCDTLVITTPNKDFDEITTKSIREYINKGGNILWFNSLMTENKNYPNVNKILDIYGVKPFETGVLMETDANKMISGQPSLIIPEVQSSSITKNIYNSTGIVILINPTKISIADDDTLQKKNVESTTLLQTSTGAFFRKNVGNTSMAKAEDDEENKSYIVGAELVKTIQPENVEEGKPALKSELVIYGENYFISDVTLFQDVQGVAIQYYSNKDIPLDSLAYLSDREEDIVARKSTGTVTYTATQEQNTIIMIIIFGVPLVIIVLGIVVWLIRRRKK